MFKRLLHRDTGRLPASSSELAQTLRAAAAYADGDAARMEYTSAADALDRAVAQTRRHGDAPTRDALAYALGRAEINLQEQLRELIEISKDTHLTMQQVAIDQQQQGAAAVELRTMFSAFGESLNEWRTNMDDWRMNVDRTLESFQQSREASIQERKELRILLGESYADRKQINTRLERIERAVLGQSDEQTSEAGT